MVLQDFDPHPIQPEARRKQVREMVSSFRPSFSTSKGEVEEPLCFDFPSEPITIGKNVWIGANVTVLKGVKIGDNCLLASGSVVTRGEYPSNTVLAGNPAKVIKTVDVGSEGEPQ